MQQAIDLHQRQKVALVEMMTERVNTTVAIQEAVEAVAMLQRNPH